MNANIPVDERLIVALDVDTEEEASEIAHELGDSVSFYKIGLQLFMPFGMDIVHSLIMLGKQIFLDLKIDDTPRTVEAAVKRVAAVNGVKFFTLQGNRDTARAAKAGRGARDYPKFLQVTYLSSWDSNDLKEHLNITDSNAEIDDAVLSRTSRILDAGCDGVIASGSSVMKLRRDYPDILIVTPGIRPEGTNRDDHKRTLTPGEAIRAGADYLVVGRPIRKSNDPRGTALHIRDEIQRALNDTQKPAPIRRTAQSVRKIRLSEAPAS